MIKGIESAVVDLVQTFCSHEKKYGGSNKSELEEFGRDLADQLASLAGDDRTSPLTLFLALASTLREKRVPRYGEIVVSANMYKRLRSLGFRHSGAQAAVDMWDMHTNE